MKPQLLSLVRGWRGAILLVAFACLTPGRAAAECGDHVTIRKHTPTAAQPTPTPVSDQAVKPPATEQPAPTRSPCNGPNCSSAPQREVPPTAPVAPGGFSVKDLTRQPGAALNAAPEQASRFDADSTSPRPTRRANSIFHPPRLG